MKNKSIEMSQCEYNLIMAKRAVDEGHGPHINVAICEIELCIDNLDSTTDAQEINVLMEVLGMIRK